MIIERLISFRAETSIFHTNTEEDFMKIIEFFNFSIIYDSPITILLRNLKDSDFGFSKSRG